MAIYTFSTKKEADTELIEQIKRECATRGTSFSHYVVKLIVKDQACKTTNSDTDSST